MLALWFLLQCMSVLALENGLARTPPMGWLSWQRFRCIIDCKKFPRDCISEDLIRRTADRMVSDGYLDAGYEYIVIDDCWSDIQRRKDGKLMPHKKRFKNGMKALSNYVHRKGLKFGIYQNYSNFTCAGFPGTLGFEQKDIDTFVEWNVDYLKLDGCFISPTLLDKVYPEYGRRLKKTGRPILFSCSWPAYQETYKVKKPNYTAIAETCNTWRVLGDIEDSWDTLAKVIDWYGNNQDRIALNAGPGHWNDPDMLVIGNYGLSVDQAKVQMAIWAIMAAPLFMSVDLDEIRPEFREILLNRAVIAVNQDVLGKQGLRVYRDKDRKVDIWKRVISDGYAIAFVSNKKYGAPYPMHYFSYSQMDIPETQYQIQDLFNAEPMRFMGHPQDRFEVKINPSGVKFYKFIPIDKNNIDEQMDVEYDH